MRPRIAVIGQSGPISDLLQDVSYRVGAAIARRGGVLFSGGRDGVMAAVSRGAQEAGGLTIGILPGDDPTEANPYVDIPITTGLGMDSRSLVLVHAVDAVIVIGGANGTLMELSAAYHCGRPVVALGSTGGWAHRIRLAAYEEKYLDHRRRVELKFADDPEEAVAITFAAIAAAAPGSSGGSPAAHPANAGEHQAG